MARPLSKHDQEGNRYVRLPHIEAAIDAALNQDLPTLCRRAAVQDQRSPDYLPSECLVHLIREARQRNDKATMNELLMPLLRRCEAILLSKVSEEIPNAAFLRKEILAQFAELFALDSVGENPDELDFFEIRFNRGFQTLRIDFLRKEKRANKVNARCHTSLPDVHESEPTADDDVFVRLSAHLRSPATQEGAVVLKELIEAIKCLPQDERDAVILCHIMGCKEESDDPNETTAATLCGVTGRTIRNRLSRAATKLLRFKEDIR